MRFPVWTVLPASLGLLAVALASGCGGGGGGGGSTLTSVATPVLTTLSSLAGVPSGAGNLDGSIATARFNGPYGVAVDGAGDLFVADALNGAIRKITPAGQVSTVSIAGAVLGQPAAVAVAAGGDPLFVADPEAASGPAVYRVSGGTAAALQAPAGGGYLIPQGLALDGKGNLFVADWGNQSVYEIQGGSDSAAPVALAAPTEGGRYASPAGVAVDQAGDVFVADAGGGNAVPGVYEIIPGANTATRLTPAFSYSAPVGVGVDGGGNLVVMDGGKDVVYWIPAGGYQGTPAVLAGTGEPGDANGAGGAASFRLDPEWGGLVLDGGGNIYLTDTGNNTIEKIKVATGNAPAAGTVSTVAGTAGDPGEAGGPAGGATFDAPGAVAVAPSGSLYVADIGNNAIRILSPATGADGLTVATLPVPVGTFGQIQAVAADAGGNVYVTDSENNSVLELSPPAPGQPAGTPWTVALLASPAKGYLQLEGVAADAEGDVCVADALGQAVYKSSIIPGGRTRPAALPAPEGGYGAPTGLALDSAGNLYVTDTGTQSLYQITPDGVVARLAGSGAAGSADGPGASASFNGPQAVAVDGDGHLFVADTGNGTIREVTLTPLPGGPPTATVTTLVGVAGKLGTVPGGLPASLFEPEGVAVNLDGTLLVTVPDAVLWVH